MAGMPKTKYQCLVHREDTASVPANPFFVADCFPYGAAKNDPCVLHRVMAVHLQVSVHPDVQIKKTMSCKPFQHMIKKSDPCV